MADINISPIDVEKKINKTEVVSGNFLKEKEVGQINPEKVNINQVEKIPESVNKKNIESSSKESAAAIKPVITKSTFQQRRAQEIDKILAEGLHEVFIKMSPEKQKEFKMVGEETIGKISILLDSAKVKVSKIISLIKKWLHIIPGVNHFFLEQEAKIKADKIIKLKNS